MKESLKKIGRLYLAVGMWFGGAAFVSYWIFFSILILTDWPSLAALLGASENIPRMFFAIAGVLLRIVFWPYSVWFWVTYRQTSFWSFLLPGLQPYLG